MASLLQVSFLSLSFSLLDHVVQVFVANLPCTECVVSKLAAGEYMSAVDPSPAPG